MVLCGCVSDCAMPRPGIPVFFLCVQVSFVGVFQTLSGAFMSGQVIFFSVLLSAGTMGVGGKVMVLRRYLL
jgi:hypothetical protein